MIAARHVEAVTGTVGGNGSLLLPRDVQTKKGGRLKNSLSRSFGRLFLYSPNIHKEIIYKLLQSNDFYLYN